MSDYTCEHGGMAMGRYCEKCEEVRKERASPGPSGVSAISPVMGGINRAAAKSSDINGLGDVEATNVGNRAPPNNAEGVIQPELLRRLRAVLKDVLQAKPTVKMAIWNEVYAMSKALEPKS